MDSQHSSQSPKPPIKPWFEYDPYTYQRYCVWAVQEWGADPINYGSWCGITEDKATAEMQQALTYYKPLEEQRLESEAAKTPAALRAAFLKAVEGMICKDRSATHGDAEDNFANIAAFWNTFTRHRKEPVQFTPQDVAAFMIMVKLSRLMSTPDHMDHWHDIAGYAACGGGILQKKLNNQED